MTIPYDTRSAEFRVETVLTRDDKQLKKVNSNSKEKKGIIYLVSAILFVSWKVIITDETFVAKLNCGSVAMFSSAISR